MWFASSRTLAASGPAISVEIAGPLSLGEDELLYTVAPGAVENLDITEPVQIQGLMRHPTIITTIAHMCMCNCMLQALCNTLM